MIIEPAEGKKYRMDGYLKANLDIAKKAVHDDWDMVIIIDGIEGGGKSVLAQQVGGYLNPSLSMENICFTPKEFERSVKTANKYTCIIFDEALSGLYAKETMGKVNKTLIKMLAEIRKKNLYILIVMPSFFELNKYVALHRSRALIHVYSPKSFMRGNFAFYNVDKKKMLYIAGKKFYSYGTPKPNFIANYPKYYYVDEVEYRKKKDSISSDDDDVIDESLYMRTFMERLLQVNWLTHKQRYEILNMPESTYYYNLKQFEEYRADSLGNNL